MSWFYLALLAPLLYAAVNLFDDNLLSFVYKTPYLACFSAGIYGALPLISRLWIDAPGIPFSLATLAAVGGFLAILCFFFYFKGLTSDTPSVVVALFSLAPATIPFFAHFIVHENLAPLQIVGFGVVLLAALGLAATDIRRLTFSRALAPALIGVALMDAQSIATKYVYQRADFYPAYMYFCAGMGIGGLFFLLLKLNENAATIRTIARKIKRLLPIFIIAELTGLAAEFILNLAISRGPVSLVKVIESIQPMFVLLIALALYPLSPKYFREAEAGKPWRKLALMAIAITGLALISVASKA